jgi:hypothetical protein
MWPHSLQLMHLMGELHAFLACDGERQRRQNTGPKSALRALKDGGCIEPRPDELKLKSKQISEAGRTSDEA